MRMRKKPWSQDIFTEHADIVVSATDHYRSRWHQKLECERIHLEVGAGKGDYWHGLAQLYPDRGIVAMERDVTAAAIALRKTAEFGKGRKRFINADASMLLDIFAAQEINVIHLNFSDPWPKKKHEKRRLTYKDKLDIYDTILAQGGELWLKTDNAGFFNYSLVSISSHNFILDEVDVSFRSKEHEDPTTEYETKFLALGQPIYRAIWRKKDA